MTNKFKWSTIRITDIQKNGGTHDKEEGPITKAKDSSTQIRVKLQHNTSIKHYANNHSIQNVKIKRLQNNNKPFRHIINKHNRI